MDDRYKIDDKEKEYELLHIEKKSWLRTLIQRLIIKVLSKLSPKKSLFYKNKIIVIKLKITTQFFPLLKGIFLKFKYPMYFRLPVKHIRAFNALIKFLKILKMQKIDFFLEDGSLLGAVRQESFAGRPKDVDLGIKEHQFSKLLDTVPLLINHGATHIITKPRHKIQKLQIILEGIRIDVEFFRKEKWRGTEMWLGETYKKPNGVNSFPIADLENLVPVKLYGKTFMSPANPEMYLEKKYGKNWRIPDKKQFFWKKQI